MPLLERSGIYGYKDGQMEAKDVRTLTLIVREHNRMPGSFDYNYPQDRYSLYPEFESEFYYTVGGKDHRGIDVTERLQHGFEY